MRFATACDDGACSAGRARCRLSLELQQATPRHGLVVGAAPSAYAQLTTVRAPLRTMGGLLALRTDPYRRAAAIAIHSSPPASRRGWCGRYPTRHGIPPGTAQCAMGSAQRGGRRVLGALSARLSRRCAALRCCMVPRTAAAVLQRFASTVGMFASAMPSDAELVQVRPPQCRRSAAAPTPACPRQAALWPQPCHICAGTGRRWQHDGAH